MAEEILVKEPLTDRMIRDGEALTRALDESGWPVVASLWWWDYESARWLLLLASPEVDTKGGLLEGYKRVNNALRAAGAPFDGPELSRSSVSIVSPNDKRVQLLASQFPPPENVSPRRVYRTSIGGHYFDDVYFYRLPAVASAA
jgi:hypothetical protein